MQFGLTLIIYKTAVRGLHLRNMQKCALMDKLYKTLRANR